MLNRNLLMTNDWNSENSLIVYRLKLYWLNPGIALHMKVHGDGAVQHIQNVTKRLKLFENEILFLVDNIGCNVSSHFDRIPSKDANYLPQIKLLSKLHAIINQRKCNPCNLYNKLSCKYVKKKMKNDDSIILY